MMTKEERLTAFRLRLDGNTWNCIGAAMGYSPENIASDLRRCLLSPPRQLNCIYPALRRWIQEHCGNSIRAFATSVGVPESRMYYYLPRPGPMPPEIVSAIAKATGLSPEEIMEEDDYVPL